MSIRLIQQALGVFLLGAHAQGAVALTAMTDGAMSSISAQDGVEIDLSVANEIRASSIRWSVDSATANAAAAEYSTLSLRGVDLLGTVGGAYSALSTLDAGATGSGDPRLLWTLDLDRVRLRAEAYRHVSDASRSYGTFALDASGRIEYANKGAVNNSVTDARLYGELFDANIFYRQLWHQHPYLVMANVDAKWNIPSGTIGIGAGNTGDLRVGVRTNAPFIDVALTWDMLYKFPVYYAAEPEFTITGNERPIIRFGWLGTLKDAELVFKSGGAWSGTTGAPAVYNVANKSEGINFSSRFNYVTFSEALASGDPGREFRWQLGEAGGGRTSIEISDWVALPGNTYAHDFPLIAIDLINPAQGVGGLCWGAPSDGPASGACSPTATRQFVNVAPGTIASTYYSAGDGYTPTVARANAPSVGIFVRDGNLLTYGRKVKILENNAIQDVFNWGLIYTLANIDANVYLYAGGNPSDDVQFGGSGNSLSYGVMADIALMSQSFSATTPTEQGFNWNKGSHLMIADTDADLGIGLVSTSFLVLANDARLWVKPHWSGNTTSAHFYEGGFDIMSPQSRFHIRGTFGGGSPSQSGGGTVVKGAFIDANLEGLWNFRFSPSRPGATIAADRGSNFMGYSLAYRLMNTNVADFSQSTAGGATDDGSFISISEPNNIAADFRLANVTGDLAYTEGAIDLRGVGEDGPVPKLVVSNNIRFGTTAYPRIQDAVVGLQSMPGGLGAQPFSVGRVEFGDRPLGQIGIPSGQMFFSMTLKPQN